MTESGTNGSRSWFLEERIIKKHKKITGSDAGDNLFPSVIISKAYTHKPFKIRAADCMSVIPQWSYFSRNMSNPQSIFDDTFSGLEILPRSPVSTRSIPGTKSILPVLFYSHILLEHNLPLSYFIAFGQTIPFCWDMLSFPNLFWNGSSSNAFSIKTLDCHNYVWLPTPAPPFSSNLQHFALAFHNLDPDCMCLS